MNLLFRNSGETHLILLALIVIGQIAAGFIANLGMYAFFCVTTLCFHISAFIFSN